MRLACVKHAASVRSEPGSNSQVHLHLRASENFDEQTRDLHGFKLAPPRSGTSTSKRCCSIKKICQKRPSAKPCSKPRLFAKSLNPIQIKPYPSLMPLDTKNARTPPTYPFLAYAIVKERFRSPGRTNRPTGPRREALSRRGVPPCQREYADCVNFVFWRLTC